MHKEWRLAKYNAKSSQPGTVMRRKIKAPHYATLLEDCLRNVMPKNHGNGITVQHGFQS